MRPAHSGGKLATGTPCGRHPVAQATIYARLLRELAKEKQNIFIRQPLPCSKYENALAVATADARAE